MVNESMVARTVKALAARNAPSVRVRDAKWIASFCGLNEGDALATLNWLRHRKLVVQADGGFKLLPDARKLVAELAASRCTDFMSFLDAGLTLVKEEEIKSPLARQLFRLYYEYLAPRGSKFDFYRNAIPEWRTQPATVKAAFKKAAETCEWLKAKPQQYMESQFIKFDRLSVYKERPILPQPYHLNGPSAITAYQEYKREMADRRASRAVKSIHKSFTIEQDKLSSLALFHGCDEQKVLSKLPQEFSKAFLKHKGVWRQVKERFISATEAA